MARHELGDPEEVLRERRVLEVVEVREDAAWRTVVVAVDVSPGGLGVERLVERRRRDPDASDVGGEGPDGDDPDRRAEAVRLLDTRMDRAGIARHRPPWASAL
jgi:hypothetical protein